MPIAFVLAPVMKLGAYWFSADLALRMTGARQASSTEAPELHRLVDELAIFARVLKPRVAIVESLSPNAFAAGRDTHHAAVVVTRGILDLLNRDELAAVLAHVRDRDILLSSIAATIAGAIAMLANVAKWSIFFADHADSDDVEYAGHSRWPDLQSAVVCPGADRRNADPSAISRSREYAADETGPGIHGNPESLARALEHLELAISVRQSGGQPSVYRQAVRGPEPRRFR